MNIYQLLRSMNAVEGGCRIWSNKPSQLFLAQLFLSHLHSTQFQTFKHVLSFNIFITSQSLQNISGSDWLHLIAVNHQSQSSSLLLVFCNFFASLFKNNTFDQSEPDMFWSECYKSIYVIKLWLNTRVHCVGRAVMLWDSLTAATFANCNPNIYHCHLPRMFV